MSKLLSTAEIIHKYGRPGDESNLVMIQLPYPMRLAWDKSKTVTRMRVHRLIADRMLAVFNDLLAHYGLAELQRLGIDLFGGCFAVRKMRGGNSWSTHSWAIAIDLDPERNQLHETAKTARFARPEYKPMHDIFYKHGFINLGIEKNFDWMHYQTAY